MNDDMDKASDAAASNGQQKADASARSPMAFGLVLDGKGGARQVSWQEAEDWQPGAAGEVLWTHMHRYAAQTHDWIKRQTNMSHVTAELLLSDAAYPTAYSEGSDLVAVLRGVRAFSERRTDTQILVQLWSDGKRLISLGEPYEHAHKAILAQFEVQEGPVDAGALFTWLVRHTIDSMNRAIMQVDSEIDKLEGENLNGRNSSKLLSRIGDIRRNALSLQRHMGPQHDALERIADRAPSWFEDDDRQAIRGTIHRLRRYLIDVEVSKESAVALMDEMRAHSASRTRFTSTVISVVSTIFLPLSFLTGLLGINVGGIPGANNSAAFWIVVLMCAVIFVLQLMFIVRMGVFRDDP